MKITNDKKYNSLINKTRYSYGFLIILQILLFFSLFQNNLSIKFTYPKAINLENGNVLVIHKLGIDVYNSCFTKLIFNARNFSSEEQISSLELFSKVSISKFNENEIVNANLFSIIINRIYIFNYEGELLYEEENEEINNLFQGYYYDITLIKKDGNIYDYMIGFVNDESQASLFFFEYNDDELSNTLKTSMTNFGLVKSNISHNILNKGIACEIMSHPENGDILVCFFSSTFYPQELATRFIDLNTYEFIDIESDNFTVHDIKGIKSVVSKDKKKSLICLNFSKEKSLCLNYTIEDNSFSEAVDYGVLCRSGQYSTSLEYMKEKSEYIFSCTDDLGDITAQIFNENFGPVKDCMKIVSGYCAYGASIIYSSELKDYYVISDIESQNTNDNFISISGERFFNETNTISSTIIRETYPFVCNLEKCLICDEESSSQSLCIECNKENNYYPISPSIHLGPFINKYIDCYNNSTKPSNFYLNKIKEYYEPCYKTCASCEYEGDGNQNNCTQCDIDHIFEPWKANSTNCVAKCTFFYYLSYGQYKCTTSPQCPDENNLLIRSERKCVNSCSKEVQYKYQYNGECIEKCPEDTIADENENLCKIPNADICTESTSQFELYDFLKEGGVEKIAKTYANEFNYTKKHISLYKNEVYRIMLYKEKECISELELPMPEIDFGICYQKVQDAYGLRDKELIVGIIDKKGNKNGNPITSYAFYHPDNGEKLNSEETCKEEVIVVKENIKSILNDSVSDIDSFLKLTGQNIDIFNKSSEFYTSICYHFDSPCDKDVALRDRLLIYYPNITLCDSGCKNTGVNLSAMMAICECKYKNLTDEESNEDDNIYINVVNEVNKILNQVNLEVMECYKDLFQYSYFTTNTGGVIFLLLIFIQIVILIIFYCSSLFYVCKYIYNIAENFILYLNKSPMLNNAVFNLKKNEEKTNDIANNSNQNLNFPPKKKFSINDDSISINKNEKKKSINKNKKHMALKTQEDFKSKRTISSKQLKIKKIIQKGKSNSSNNLQKSEMSIKSNNPSLINEPKTDITFFGYLSIALDDMNFYDVARTDNRLFFDYFCDKLKKKQLILQLFFLKNPLKPLTIKLLILILDIEICFVVNAMFINEDYISYIFHSKVKETFISFIPRSINRFIFTVISSIVVSYFINCIFVEESKIKGILKREKEDVNNLKYQINLSIKEVKIRFLIFIIIALGFSFYSWFYISCFNHIYPHMRVEWVKSSAFIIIIIHIFSIFFILISTLLRFVSFEIKSEKMYRASLWLA